MSLRQLRYDRTRTSNIVRQHIAWMLKEPAPYTQTNGLPSWWPFWSDVLVDNVRKAVHAAIALTNAEVSND